MSVYSAPRRHFNMTLGRFAHVDSFYTMSFTTAETLAIYDNPDKIPLKPSSVPVAVVFRNFSPREKEGGLRYARLDEIRKDLREQAEEAAVCRSGKLAKEADVEWLVRSHLPTWRKTPDLFLELDRSAHLLPPCPAASAHSSKPTLHVCLSAPPEGALIHSTASPALPTIFLQPGDAILLHPEARMRLCAGHEAETIFLRFYSDPNHPANARPPPRIPSPEVEPTQEAEAREIRAKLDARLSAMFAEKEAARAAREDEVQKKKEATKMSLEALEKEERMTKEEIRLWNEMLTERRRADDAADKKVEADEKEAAEMVETYRRKKEAVEALKRELEGGAINLPPAASVAAPRTSATNAAATSGLAAEQMKGKGKGISHADKIIDLASSQISVKAEPDAEGSPEWDAPPAYLSASVIEPAKQTRKRKASSIANPAPAPAEETAKSTRRGRAY